MRDITNLIIKEYINRENGEIVRKIDERMNEIVNHCNKLLPNNYDKLENMGCFFYVPKPSYELFMNTYRFIYLCSIKKQEDLLCELLILIICKSYSYQNIEYYTKIKEINLRIFSYLFRYHLPNKKCINSNIFGEIKLCMSGNYFINNTEFFDNIKRAYDEYHKNMVESMLSKVKILYQIN